MELENWKAEYPVLNDVDILLTQSGNIPMDTDFKEECSCPRNQNGCSEYGTEYRCYITMTKQGKMIYHLSVFLEQKNRVEGYHVYYDTNPIIKSHCLQWDKIIFTNQIDLENMIRDFIDCFCSVPFEDLVQLV